MIELLVVFQESLVNSEAANTLKDLSPWAYVIVIFAIGVAGVFYRLYVKEKEHRDALEKEFRSFMSDSLSQQIQVSKDVIDLVKGNRSDVNDALHTFHTSDAKLEGLIGEVKSQLASIESHITHINR